MALVLFDLDDTLVDRQAAYGRWAERFCRSIGGDAEALAFVLEVDEGGLTDRDRWCRRLRDRFGFAEPVDELRARWHAEYLAEYLVDRATVDALTRLRARGHQIGIVTNGPASQTAKIIRNNLHEHVDGCVVSELVGARKPERAIFEAAAAACGASLEGGWMVGDAPATDMAGGRAAGLTTVWLPRGRAWDEVGHRPDPFAVEAGLKFEPIPAGWRPDHQAVDVTAAVRLVLGEGSPP